MEGSHGQLRPRLADGLRRDRTHRLAQFHDFIVAEIGAIALNAESVHRLAGQWRPHCRLVGSGIVYSFRVRPSDKMPFLEKDGPRGIDQIRREESALYVFG